MPTIGDVLFLQAINSNVLIYFTKEFLHFAVFMKEFFRRSSNSSVDNEENFTKHFSKYCFDPTELRSFLSSQNKLDDRLFFAIDVTPLIFCTFLPAILVVGRLDSEYAAVGLHFSVLIESQKSAQVKESKLDTNFLLKDFIDIYLFL